MFLKMIMIARKVSSKRIARIWRRESKARFQKKKTTTTTTTTTTTSKQHFKRFYFEHII